MKEVTMTAGDPSQIRGIPWFLPPTLQGHPVVESRSQWTRRQRAGRGQSRVGKGGGTESARWQATGIPSLGEAPAYPWDSGILQEQNKLSKPQNALPPSVPLLHFLLPFFFCPLFYYNSLIFLFFSLIL